MALNCSQNGNETSVGYRTIQASSLGLILVVALCLNAKIFCVILKQNRESRKAVTIFLLNMTLVSGLVALLLIPFNIHATIENTWVFGEIFCQINGFTSVFLCTDMVFTLLCMTIDRYVSVIKPLKHRWLMTRHTGYRMLLVVHLISLLLAAIPIAGVGHYQYHPGTKHCSPAWHDSCVYYFLIISLVYVTPILGMLGTYSRIIARVRTSRRLIEHWKTRNSSDAHSNIASNEDARMDHAANGITTSMFQHIEKTNNATGGEGSPSSSRSTRRCSRIASVIHRIAHRGRVPQEYRVARTSFILLLTFAILWTPYIVAHSCLVGRCHQSSLFTVSMYLVYLNAVANPIIYALSNRAVMQGFRSHFRRRGLCFARTHSSERS